MQRTRPAPPHHPVVVAHRARRAADMQMRIADTITRFAGSMPFVYLHAIVFAGWMLFVEPSPWPALTLVVSLEAIFLSAFVMIGQNRQAEFQHAKADHDFVEEELEDPTTGGRAWPCRPDADLGHQRAVISYRQRVDLGFDQLGVPRRSVCSCSPWTAEVQLAVRAGGPADRRRTIASIYAWTRALAHRGRPDGNEAPIGFAEVLA